MNRNDHIIFQDYDNKGIITLNRPKVLNALTLEMATELFETLLKWKTEKVFVMIRGSGRAFCAGGDIKTVYETRKKGDKKYSLDLQKLQAAICHLTKTYPIPFIAIVDGIVMGAGAGISLHGKYRIATENTIFSIPELQIGHIPDIGASYLASRLPGRLGYFLFLTANRLKGTDTVRAGIATHFCSSEMVGELEKQLISCTSAYEIDHVLKTSTEMSLPQFSLELLMPKLNHYFSARTVEGILAKLEEDGTDWARNISKQLKKMPPTSLKVAYKAITLGSRMALSECLLMEYRLVKKFLDKKDFFEDCPAPS
ncbi:hypothetical protein JTB14_034652 [Gonioctena quinquepunctata]|nr:hypothetical protein JTB14_034652 [Gonioctena quinquepunctata]